MTSPTTSSGRGGQPGPKVMSDGRRGEAGERQESARHRAEAMGEPADAGGGVVGEVGEHVGDVGCDAEQRAGGDDPRRGEARIGLTERRDGGQQAEARPRTARTSTTVDLRPRLYAQPPAIAMAWASSSEGPRNAVTTKAPARATKAADAHGTPR